MKKILPTTILLAAFTCVNLNAQGPPPQDIRRIYEDVHNDAVPSQIIATSDCGFLVAGTAGQRGFLLKLNPSGDTLWNRGYLYGEETSFNGLTELPSGKLVAVGRCRNCAPGDTTQKALALSTDADGNALRDTTFGRLNYGASAMAVITTVDGKAAVAGNFVWATFLSPSNVFFTVLDENLSPGLWEEYNGQYYDSPRALAQASDGGYILAGYSNASLTSAAQAQLFRTDEQGQLRWKNTSAYFSSRFNSVQEAPDGRIVALGWRQVDTVYQRDVYLAIHHPDDGSLLLHRNYGSTDIDEGEGLHTVEGGYLAVGTWGTPSQPGWGKRDWVFRLDDNFDIVDEYFDDGYLAQYNMVNAVPLSPDGRNFAYFSRIAIFSDRQNLFYKRALQGRHVRLSKAPQHYQLLPRSLETNRGTAVYEGSLETPGFYDEMRLKVFRNDALIQTLTDATPQDFSFQVDIEAELANYRFKLMGVKNGLEYPEAEASDVVAGDAYIIQGQSNAVAAVPYDPDNSIPHAYRYHRQPFVRNFGLKIESDSLYVWHKEVEDDGYFADNRSGQWGLVLGKKIAEEQGIPVAILNGGIVGISIDQMLPDPADPHSTSHSYGEFFQQVEHSGLRDQIRAIMFFQGETNALPGYNETVDSYKNKYLQLRSAWQSDFTYEREYLFQIRPGCWSGNFGVIQEAQRQLALELPNAAIMSSTGMEHDGCHYHYFNGYERAGEDMYRLLVQDVYGAPPMPDRHPPTVDSAWFSQCGRQEITLRLQHEGDIFEWTPGWETDFRLEGVANATVAGGQVSGNRITLFLSEPPASSFSGLTYTGHSLGSGAPVKNANGIGLLGFYNFPVAPPESLFESYSEGICPGENYELPDGRVVGQPGKYFSEFISVEGCDSLIVTELVFYDPPASPGLEVQPVSCYGQADGVITAFPEGGTPPYTYLWSDGQSLATAIGLSPGVYTLTLTDFNGCEAVVATGLDEPPPIDIPDVSIVSASCPEAADGNAMPFVTGGTPGYSFSWSDGQSTAMATGLAAGIYSLTIVDANGCEAAVGVEISALAYDPDLSIEQDGDNLTVGEQGAGYQWIQCDNGEAIPGATGRSFTIVESGSYAVVVTDSSGACRDTSICLMVVGIQGSGQRVLQSTAFPNPNNGQFTLSLPWAAEARLYDAMGQLNYRNHYGRGNHRVSLNRLPPGCYFLQLQSGNDQQVLKLVIY